MSTIQLNFSGLAKAPKNPVPSSTIKYNPDKQPITYYEGVGVSKEDRMFITARLMRSFVTVETAEEPAGSWVWSIVDMVFPGLAANVIRASSIYEPHPLTLEDSDLGVLVSHDDDNVEINDTLSPEANLMILDNIRTDPDYEDPEWCEVIAFAASLLYAIGKRPDARNLTGFTQKRIKAYFNKISFVPSDKAWSMSEQNMPSLAGYQTVHSYFNSHVDLRELVTKVFIDWTLSTAVTPDQDAVATFCKLWKDNGFVHVIIIRGLLVKFSEIISSMPLLRSEVLAFIDDYERFSNSDEPLIRFDRVIKGDRSTIMPSRSYPELFRIAKQVAAATDKTFELYAPEVGESPLWDDFVTKCNFAGITDFK